MQLYDPRKATEMCIDNFDRAKCIGLWITMFSNLTAVNPRGYARWSAQAHQDLLPQSLPPHPNC